MADYEYTVRFSVESPAPKWISTVWVDDFDIARHDCNRLRDIYGYEAAWVVKRRKAGPEERVH